MTATRLLTAEELAEQLRLTTNTVRAYARRGLIPAIRITPKVIRYDPERVRQALQTRSDERRAANA